MNNMHIWVLVADDLNTGDHVPYLPAFFTKKECQKEVTERNKLNKIESSPYYRKYFRAVKYIPVWDLKRSL